MQQASARPFRAEATEFEDGFGRRCRTVGATDTDELEALYLRDELTTVPSFEFALRERVNRLANFHHSSYGPVHNVERFKQAASTLALVSEHVSGVRLSKILADTERRRLTLDINTAICLTRQLVSAVAVLHEQVPDVVHGAIAPERLVITPNARVIIVEYVLGGALEQLQYSQTRYWSELSVALPQLGASLCFDRRADVMQVGLVALSLILGRSLGTDEYPARIGKLVGSAWAASAEARLSPLPPGVRWWLSRALQLDARNSFSSCIDANMELDSILDDSEQVVGPSALEGFLTRYYAVSDSELVEESHAPVPAAARPASISIPAATPALPVSVRPAEATPPIVTAHSGGTASRPDVAPAAAAVSPVPLAPGAAPPATAVFPVPLAPVAALPAVAISYAAPSRPPVTQPPAGAPPVSAQVMIVGPTETPDAVSPVPLPPVAALPAVAISYAATLRPAATQPPAAAPIVAAPVMIVGPTETSEFEAACVPKPEPSRLITHQPKAASEPRPDWPNEVAFETWQEEEKLRPQRSSRLTLAIAVIVIGVAVSGALGARRYLMTGSDRARTGTLVVDTNPSGVPIEIDGQPKGSTPVTVTLDAGAHVLELLGLNEPRTIPLNVTAGNRVSQYIELRRTKAATGQLQVRTEPAGAKVTIDGQLRGTSPLSIDDLTPGAHRVDLENEFRSLSEEVTVDAGTTGSLVVPLGATPSSGWVSLTTPVDTQLFESGRLIGTSRIDRIMMSAGRHDIEIVNEPLQYRATRTVQIVPGKVSPIRPEWPKGTISLNALPWADVWVDGERIGETPIGNLALPIGPHEIVFRHPELGERTYAISTMALSPTRLSVDMTKK